MPFASINGQQIFYQDSGGDAPAIVFSHGLLMDHEMFAPQVAAFQDSYRCIVWDERAHGRTASDETPAPFSYYDSADDLAGLQPDYLRMPSIGGPKRRDWAPQGSPRAVG